MDERLFADNRQGYPSDTALAEAVAKKVGVGRETARRWLVQAEVNAGSEPLRFQRRPPAQCAALEEFDPTIGAVDQVRAQE